MITYGGLQIITIFFFIFHSLYKPMSKSHFQNDDSIKFTLMFFLPCRSAFSHATASAFFEISTPIQHYDLNSFLPCSHNIHDSNKHPEPTPRSTTIKGKSLSCILSISATAASTSISEPLHGSMTSLFTINS